MRIKDWFGFKLGNYLLNTMEATGSFRPITAAEMRIAPREHAPFVGDIPRQAGTEHYQPLEVYRIPRRGQEEVRDLLYTPRGMAWAGGTLHERYSIRKPVLEDLISPPFPRAKASIPRGTVVQTQFPNTYGDWVGEYLMTLATSLPIRPPLLMPRHLMERPYVRRDLARLGLETMVVERPVLVHEALVLRKTHHFWFFTADQVAAYRRAFRIDPPRPRPGPGPARSCTSPAKGEKSEYKNERAYPSETTAEIMAELGAKTVLARETSQEQYAALAGEAETVVADHGSAICNLLFWDTRNVIELFSEGWWNSYFLFLAKGAGVENYAMIRVDDLDRSELRRRLVEHLPRP